MANGPSSSPSGGKDEKLSTINETHEARKGELSMGTKAALLSVALGVAAFLNPLSSKSAQAGTLTPGIAGPKVSGNDLLKSVALGGNPYETQIDISQIPAGFREDFRRLSAMLQDAKTKKLITVEGGGEFIGKKTGIKGPEELGKVIYAVDTKQLTLGTFEQLIGINFNELVRDLGQSANGTKTTDEIRVTTTGKFLSKVIDDKDVLGRTLKNFSPEGWQNEISKGILDGKVYGEYQKLFVSGIDTLQKRGLLTKETIYLAHRTASSIAYQESLRYKENENGEVVYNGDENSVKTAWLNMGKNAWMSGREYLATEKSVRGLMLNPNFESVVYRVKVGYEGKITTIDFMLPTSQAEYVLGSQAIRHSIVGKERGQLASVVASAGYDKEARDSMNQLVAKIEQETAESEKRTAEIKKETAEIKKETAESRQRKILMDEYIQITEGKSSKEIKPKLAKIIDIRNKYASLPGAKPEVLAQYNEMISSLQ